MDIKKIYVIFNDVEFGEEAVREDLAGEGYVHDFLFFNRVPAEEKNKYLEEVDEVWLFGDCHAVDDFYLAVGVGSDFWQMG